MKSLSSYPQIAELFHYPDAGFPERVEAVGRILGEIYPGAAEHLRTFVELLPADDVTAMQELFVRSFDVQAVTTLDVGYTLFGDDYKRGELLANLNREHQAVDNDCYHELADHLPNLLRLLARLNDEDLKQDLVQEILAPALKKMIEEFNPERIQKKNASYKKHYKTLIDVPKVKDGSREGATLYQFTLMALLEVLKQDFTVVEKEISRRGCEFLGRVMEENEIEERACNGSFQQFTAPVD